MGTADTWQTALDEVVEELLTCGKISQPPVDVFDLAGRLKIDVAFDYHQRCRGRHKRLEGRSSIFLRPDGRPERLQWATAHELGEVLAYRVFERLGSDEDEIRPRLREEVANLLASRILLPSQWFADDVRRLQCDLLRLKQIYRTASHELIAYRLLDLGEPSIITVFDHGRLTRRRGNCDARPPRLQPVERDCWADVHSRNRPLEMRRGGLAVHGWPVHEEGWKRELLLTTLRL